MGIDLTTYFTQAIEFHKAFFGCIKNRTEINYILVAIVNTLDMNRGILFCV